MKLTSKFNSKSITLDDRIIVLRELTAGDLNAYRMGLVTIDVEGNAKVTAENANAKMVFLCAGTETAVRAFKSVEEVAALPSRTVEAMFKVCSELNALDKEAEIRAGKA